MSRQSDASDSYTVHCACDPAAGFSYVSESDAPGLATEATTVESMQSKLELMIPELLLGNALLQAGDVVTFQLLPHRGGSTPAATSVTPRKERKPPSPLSLAAMANLNRKVGHLRKKP